MGNTINYNLQIHQKKSFLSNPEKVQIFISTIIGILLGILTSFIVNAVLLEISLNRFFSLYFGCLFITLGILIIYRINTSSSQIVQSRKSFLLFFSTMIIISGIMSFLLDKAWFTNLNITLKIPIYGIVGIAISYAIVFSIIDILNQLLGLCQKEYSKPIVESHFQIYFIMIVSLIMGCFYGILFGYLDLEDNIFKNHSFLRQEYFCFPIGILMGGIGGGLNEYFRLTGADYREIPKMDKYDEEI